MGAGRPKGLARANGRARNGHARQDAEDGYRPGGAGGRRNPEAWFRALVEQVPAVVYVGSSDGGLLYIAPQVEDMLGYPLERWFSEPGLWRRSVHPGDLEHVFAEGMRAYAAGEPFRAEYRMVAEDGRVVWVRDDAVLVPDGGGASRGLWRGVMVDVTVAKEAVLSLRESEKRFRELFENAMEGIARISPEGGTIEHCNPAYARMLGLTPSEAAGRSFFEFVEGKEEEEAWRQRELRLGGVSSRYEVTITAAAGERKVLQCGGYPLHDPDGAYMGAVQTAVDVTERREHEAALRASEELFRTTFEAAAVGIAHVAPDGRWIRINDKLCEISGYPREELLGMNYLDLTVPGEAKAEQERVRRLLAGDTGPYTAERRCVRKDGSRVWVNLHVSLVGWEGLGGTVYFVCIAEDITLRKLKELIPVPLTSREMSVLQGIVSGRTNLQISADLAHSLGTIKLDVQRVLRKLDVRERTTAASRAIEIGLVAPPSP